MRARAAPPSCRSTAWGQAQESSRDTDPEQGRSPGTCHLELSKWRGVQETIVFLYGKRGSDLWEPWVSPGSKCLTWAPLALGILGDGPYVVGLSAAGPSSGVPALHDSSLRVHPMGISAVEDPGLGVSGVCGVLCSALQVSALWVLGVGVNDAASPYLRVPWFCHSGLWDISQSLLPGLDI